MQILLADDQARVRYALRALLERQPGITEVVETLNAAETLDQVLAICPDLLLLDWGLVADDASTWLDLLRRACPHMRIVSISGRPEARSESLQAGVAAFVSKSEPPERLLAAIQAAVPSPE